MSEREHERAVQLALRTDAELAKLFNRLGTRQAPRGRVLTAYRQARRALKGSVADMPVVRGILQELRTTLADVAYNSLVVAERIGTQQAIKTLQLYDLPTMPAGMTQITEPYDAWMSTIDGQLAGVLALAAAENEEAILGDDARVGVLSPAPIVREGARWLAFATLVGVTSMMERNTSSRDAYVRQAVAAIDERTTDCCLRVHGTTATLRGKFQLAGTPRFADRMHAPPFHWYCRTSVALVRAEDADDDLTRRMVDAAEAELDARATTGTRVEIHPADATSRR
ncbi:MAG: hypothetical protein R3A10_08055 [Caldilineaceae bacterium]